MLSLNCTDVLSSDCSKWLALLCHFSHIFLCRLSIFPACFTASSSRILCPQASWTAPAQTIRRIARKDSKTGRDYFCFVRSRTSTNWATGWTFTAKTNCIGTVAQSQPAWGSLEAFDHCCINSHCHINCWKHQEEQQVVAHWRSPLPLSVVGQPCFHWDGKTLDHSTLLLGPLLENTMPTSLFLLGFPSEHKNPLFTNRYYSGRLALPLHWYWDDLIPEVLCSQMMLLGEGWQLWNILYLLFLWGISTALKVNRVSCRNGLL